MLTTWIAWDARSHRRNWRKSGSPGTKAVRSVSNATATRFLVLIDLWHCVDCLTIHSLRVLRFLHPRPTDQHLKNGLVDIMIVARTSFLLCQRDYRKISVDTIEHDEIIHSSMASAKSIHTYSSSQRRQRSRDPSPAPERIRQEIIRSSDERTKVSMMIRGAEKTWR